MIKTRIPFLAIAFTCSAALSAADAPAPVPGSDAPAPAAREEKPSKDKPGRKVREKREESFEAPEAPNREALVAAARAEADKIIAGMALDATKHDAFIAAYVGSANAGADDAESSRKRALDVIDASKRELGVLVKDKPVDEKWVGMLIASARLPQDKLVPRTDKVGEPPENVFTRLLAATGANEEDGRNAVAAIVSAIGETDPFPMALAERASQRRGALDNDVRKLLTPEEYKKYLDVRPAPPAERPAGRMLAAAREKMLKVLDELKLDAEKAKQARDIIEDAATDMRAKFKALREVLDKDQFQKLREAITGRPSKEKAKPGEEEPDQPGEDDSMPEPDDNPPEMPRKE